jgi:hypothetical protein
MGELHLTKLYLDLAVIKVRLAWNSFQIFLYS